MVRQRELHRLRRGFTREERVSEVVHDAHVRNFHRLDREDAEKYLKNRAERRFTIVGTTESDAAAGRIEHRETVTGGLDGPNVRAHEKVAARARPAARKCARRSGSRMSASMAAAMAFCALCAPRSEPIPFRSASKSRSAE